MKDGRNIGKFGSEKRSLNDEVGPQKGDQDAPEAQVTQIALAPGGFSEAETELQQADAAETSQDLFSMEGNKFA